MQGLRQAEPAQHTPQLIRLCGPASIPCGAKRGAQLERLWILEPRRMIHSPEQSHTLRNIQSHFSQTAQDYDGRRFDTFKEFAMSAVQD